MRSIRLILVLIIVGIGLLFAGITRMDMNQTGGGASVPASPGASWLTGLLGAAMLAGGIYLLRAAYLGKGKALVVASPARQRLLMVLGVLAALVFIGFGIMSKRQRKSAMPASSSSRDSSAATPERTKMSKPDEQLTAKLQPIVECVNVTFSHYEGVAKTYHEEMAGLSTTNKPLELGSRPMWGYFNVGGLGNISDPAKDCADGLDQAVSMPPVMADLDAPAKDASSALRAIAGPGKEMQQYLEQKGYLDDRFGKGRQLDSIITPLLDRILADSKQLRAVSVREDHTLRIHELDAVAKAEGHSMRWDVLNTMLASRESEDELVTDFRNQQLDQATVAKALQSLQAAHDLGEQSNREHPATQGSAQVWSQIDDAVGRQLAAIKDIREALAKPESDPANQQEKLRDLVKSESSDFNNVVEMYNGAIRY